MENVFGKGKKISVLAALWPPLAPQGVPICPEVNFSLLDGFAVWTWLNKSIIHGLGVRRRTCWQIEVLATDVLVVHLQALVFGF
jgi:hypothetical protein